MQEKSSQSSGLFMNVIMLMNSPFRTCMHAGCKVEVTKLLISMVYRPSTYQTQHPSPGYGINHENCNGYKVPINNTTVDKGKLPACVRYVGR